MFEKLDELKPALQKLVTELRKEYPYASVLAVDVAEDSKSCRVVVPDDQLSLAIGKEGQNARLAVRLTGVKIDIKSRSQAAEEEN